MLLNNRYLIEEPIGRGGMATIYLGRDIRMDRVVVIKMLREIYSSDPKFVKRFQTEAKLMSSLQHPNIVQVYDYGKIDNTNFIVTELVEGTDLRRYLRSRGILENDRAIIIAYNVALGLGEAHRRGIVHRGVNPQHILIGRGGSIKLTGFNIASGYETVQYYSTGYIPGGIDTPAADVYALGIVIYEMVTGHAPFDDVNAVAVAMQHMHDAPKPPSQLNPNIPTALEEIIMRCLEKVPDMRYRDGTELARALEALM